MTWSHRVVDSCVFRPAVRAPRPALLRARVRLRLGADPRADGGRVWMLGRHAMVGGKILGEYPSIDVAPLIRDIGPIELVYPNEPLRTHVDPRTRRGAIPLDGAV